MSETFQVNNMLTSLNISSKEQGKEGKEKRKWCEITNE